jgi:hypothetical protein
MRHSSAFNQDFSPLPRQHWIPVLFSHPASFSYQCDKHHHNARKDCKNKVSAITQPACVWAAFGKIPCRAAPRHFAFPKKAKVSQCPRCNILGKDHSRRMPRRKSGVAKTPSSIRHQYSIAANQSASRKKYSSELLRSVLTRIRIASHCYLNRSS